MRDIYTASYRSDSTSLVSKGCTLDRSSSTSIFGFGDVNADSLLGWGASIVSIIRIGFGYIVTFFLCSHFTVSRAVTIVTHLL